MRPLPILASSTDPGINLRSVAEAATAALAEPQTLQFTGAGTLARATTPPSMPGPSNCYPQSAQPADGGLGVRARDGSPGRSERESSAEICRLFFSVTASRPSR